MEVLAWSWLVRTRDQASVEDFVVGRGMTLIGEVSRWRRSCSQDVVNVDVTKKNRERGRRERSG